MAKHTRYFTTIAATALLSAGLVAHAGAQTIKIGVNEPLTGPFAASGTYVVNGAKIAADEINAKGGVLGKKIELVIEDNKSNPTEAAAVAEKLITARQGAGDDGRLGLEPDARRDAEADGIQGADGGRDLLVGQDHDHRQSLHLPHLAAVGGRGRGVQDDRRQAARSRRPTSSSSTTTGAAAPRKISARC